MSWPDGSVYKGGWKASAQHGTGYYSDKDGFKFKGKWENGKLVDWIEEPRSKTCYECLCG